MTDFLVTGAGGALGSVLMRELTRLGRSSWGVISPHGPAPFSGQVWNADLCDPRTFRERLLALTPKVIVHLAAVPSPNAAYRDPEYARKLNVESTAVLVAYAERLGARFLFASTDLVFDGEAAPYDEDATPEPLSIYGRTKLEAECHVLTYRRGVVLRFPLLYGMPEVSRKATFFEAMLDALRAGQALRLFTDEVRTPLWLDDAARACVRIADSELRGVVHLGGPERLSRFEMGQRVARAIGASPSLLHEASRADVGEAEPRARDTSLDNARYVAQFGEAPGRSLHAALPLLLAHRPNPDLS
ncbi:MAG TPA: SDR family oxidoreductase [Polyangiales bacterium]|nr:SDR family oxidoreductase [Polyangiales bacterium]